MSTTLRELAGAEATNLELSIKALGDSIQIVSHFENAYGALPPLDLLPEGGLESDETMAVVAVLHEFAFCRRQLTMSVLTLMRAYKGDALLHLRRGIEACAFAVRMSKHPEVVHPWLCASGGDVAYRRYRDAFRSRDLFPDSGHSDHEPELDELKSHYEHCSRLMHGSIFGLGGHFDYPDSGSRSIRLKFFDLEPGDSLVSVLNLILSTHMRFLQLFGKMLKPYSRDGIAVWMGHLKSVEAVLAVHREVWKEYVPNPMLEPGESESR